MANSLIQVLVERDGISEESAIDLIKTLRDEIDDGADPEEILHDDLGLEPDYIFDLLDY